MLFFPALLFALVLLFPSSSRYQSLYAHYTPFPQFSDETAWCNVNSPSQLVIVAPSPMTNCLLYRFPLVFDNTLLLSYSSHNAVFFSTLEAADFMSLNRFFYSPIRFFLRVFILNSISSLTPRKSLSCWRHTVIQTLVTPVF